MAWPLLNQAWILASSGLADAGPSLVAAKKQIDLIQDPEAKQYIWFDLLATEGIYFRDKDPARALKSLNAAAVIYEDYHPLSTAAIYYLRALALKAQGNIDQASRELHRALESLDAARGGIPKAELRGPGIKGVDTVYDTLIQLDAERGHGEAALDASEQRRARLLLDWLSAVPENLDDQKWQFSGWAVPASVRKAQRYIPRKLAMVVYEPLPEKLLIWVVRPDGITLKSVPIAATVLGAQVQRMTESLHGWKQELQEAAADLYDSLLAPVAQQLKPEETLLLVPREPLDSVPFPLLFERATGQYLIENRLLAVVPSLNVFVALQEQAGSEDFSQADVLAITDPKVDRLDPLPAARQEGDVLRKLYGSRAKLVSGQAADREVFLEGLKRYRIVHFGGHAEANSTQPWLSNLSLAPRPDRSDSGVLYSRELVGPMDAVADLVVLSACGSAGGAAQPGEGVAGLVWPLFSRGVPRVIATLWSVKDGEAGAITTTFYRHLRAGEAPLNALRLAQLQALEAQRHDARPSFGWAAFQLYGAVSDRPAHFPRE